MKILVTGATGQVGSEIIKALQNYDMEVFLGNRFNMPLEKPFVCKKYVEEIAPHIIIHAGAYTKVDKSEEEQELAHIINAKSTEAIAKASAKINAKLIYLSTDYVFDGSGNTPYEVDDLKAPLNVYGATKLLGEEAVEKLSKKFFIVRISWVFGKNGTNFVNTILNLGKSTDQIYVVKDQIGSPTYAKDLAQLLLDMAETTKYGIYHATNEGFCSWYDFAKMIFKEAGMKTHVVPILSGERPCKARRPKNSRLSKKSLLVAGFHLLPPYEDALRRYLQEIQ